MIPIPPHAGQQSAGQELFWYGSDKLELYQSHMAEWADELRRNGWMDANFNYCFNSEGFRCEEFQPTQPAVMTLGCSHTLGVGLAVEQTWSHLVSQELHMANWNLGIGGASNDTAFRMAHYWIAQLAPAVVILLSPEPTRFELHTIDDTVENLGPWNPGHAQQAQEFTKHWLTNPVNATMDRLKNTLAIQHLCEQRNIKFVVRNVESFGSVDKARDLQHYGPVTHRHMADAFLSCL
jgi:hypothetical protein